MKANLCFPGSSPSQAGEMAEVHAEAMKDNTYPATRSVGVSSILIHLQGSGSKSPIFFVHGAGGIPHTFVKLAKQLSDDRPIYAFQSRGLDGNSMPYLRVEDMAADYLAELRSIQPHGPYLLGGYSLGALIAYEMARSLRRDGEPIDLLINLDMPAPAGYMRFAHIVVKRLAQILRWSDLRRLEVYDHIYGVINLYLSLDMRERIAQARLDVKARLGQWDDARSINARAALGGVADPADRVFRMNCRASHDYMPDDYEGSMLIFKTTLGRPHYPIVRDNKMRWGRLARGGTETILIECRHADLIRQPNINQVGNHLRARLARIES